MGGAQPKTSTTPLSKPMATGWARTRCSASLDQMGCPIDWAWAYLAKRVESTSWWPELQSLSPGQISDVQVQELAKIRLWVLGCQQPRTTKQAGGLPHLAWAFSDDETSYQNASSRVPGTSRRWGRSRPWHWLRPYSTVLSGQGLLLV